VIAAHSRDWSLKDDRYKAYVQSNALAKEIHQWIVGGASKELVADLGLIQTRDPIEITTGGVSGTLSRLEIHSVRQLRRVGPDGNILDNVVIEITQSFRSSETGQKFRGGCTIIFDRDQGDVRYVIRKRVAHIGRMAAQQNFYEVAARQGLQGTYFTESSFGAEPFAMMHRHG